MLRRTLLLSTVALLPCAALAALGAIEHLFLALPFRDGALWGWALPNTRKAALPADRMITLEGES